MLFFALFYALIFWVVAFRRPFYALVMIWALAPFQKDLGIGIAKFSLTELNLLLVMPLLLLRMRDGRNMVGLGPLAWPIGSYLVICALSMVHWRGGDAIVSMVQMGLYIVFTVQVFANLVTPEELIRIPQTIVITGAIWSIIGIRYHFDFLTHLKNAFGSSLSVAFLVAFDLWLAAPKGARRNWLLAGSGIILAGLILSLSRGSWIGAVGGVLVIIMLRRASNVLMRVCVVAAPLLFICWNLIPEKQQQYAVSFDTNRYNISARIKSLHQAQEQFAESPIFGKGVGLRKQYDATNLVWTTLAETGVMGALTFAWIFVAFYRVTWRTRRQLDIKDPYFSFLTIGAALMTCKLLHGMVDHYWSRGAITLAWGGAGMVLVAAQLPVQRAAEAARALAEQKRQARRRGLELPAASPPSGSPRSTSPRPALVHAYAPLGSGSIHAYAPALLLPERDAETVSQRH